MCCSDEDRQIGQFTPGNITLPNNVLGKEISSSSNGVVTSTVTVTAAATSTGVSSKGSAQTKKVGLAVGLSLGLIAIGALVGLLWVWRKNKRGARRAESAESKPLAAATDVPKEKDNDLVKVPQSPHMLHEEAFQRRAEMDGRNIGGQEEHSPARPW